MPQSAVAAGRPVGEYSHKAWINEWTTKAAPSIRTPKTVASFWLSHLFLKDCLSVTLLCGPDLNRLRRSPLQALCAPVINPVEEEFERSVGLRAEIDFRPEHEQLALADVRFYHRNAVLQIF